MPFVYFNPVTKVPILWTTVTYTRNLCTTILSETRACSANNTPIWWIKCGSQISYAKQWTLLSIRLTAEKIRLAYEIIIIKKRILVITLLRIFQSVQRIVFVNVKSQFGKIFIQTLLAIYYLKSYTCTSLQTVSAPSSAHWALNKSTFIQEPKKHLAQCERNTFW